MEYRNAVLTPETAREWLGTMPECQRKPSMKVVAEYAADMENGRWVCDTGDAIRFDKRGRMIDGQHRCLAVIESKHAIVVTVIEGLEDDVYMVLDRGKKRTAADTISGSMAKTRAAISRTVLALRDGIPNASAISGSTSRKEHPVSATEVAEFANEHEELMDRLCWCYNCAKTANNGRFSASVTVCLVAAIWEQTGSLECAERFFAELVLPVAERPTVLTMAREKAAAFAVTKGRSKNIQLFAIYLMAFRSWFRQETPKVIQPSSITSNVGAVPLKRDWAMGQGRE